jgi:hypothetical protein
MASLTMLEQLILTDNKITGSIPHWIGKLTSLRDLNLCVNLLQSSVPFSIGNLKNLVRFKGTCSKCNNDSALLHLHVCTAFEQHAYTREEVVAHGLHHCKLHSKVRVDGHDRAHPREYKCPPFGISGTLPSSIQQLSQLEVFYMVSIYRNT